MTRRQRLPERYLPPESLLAFAFTTEVLVRLAMPLLRWLPVVLTCLTINSVLGQDFETEKLKNWHQWRGPLASGVSPSANPPLNWSEQTNIKWKIPIVGEGSSTPIVWNDMIFLLSAVETVHEPSEPVQQHPESRTVPPNKIFEFVVWCVDRETGDVRWKKVVTDAAPIEGRHSSTTYAAASPTTDGEFVYASFGSYGVFCLNFSGDIVWQRDLGDMRTRRGWGEAVSPVIHDRYLVVNWDQEDQSKIFVLDSRNGKTIWELERDEPTTWATPLVVEINGQTQLITNGTNRIRSYELASGKLIWESGGTTLNAIPCPVMDGDHVICMAGYRGNLAMKIDATTRGEIDTRSAGPDRPVKWRFEQHTPYVPSPLLLGDRLYFTKSNAAVLNCLDSETGKPVYELTRLPGLQNMYASPAAAQDRIYLTSREGVTLVIRNSPKFEVLATNRLSDDIDASPALAGEQIFLRGRRFLYCIEE